MITRPLDLQSKLTAPPRDFDVFFWVTGALIALLFSLQGSRFIVSPGVAVQVGQDPSLVLPEATNTQLGGASVVVSYRRDNMILFEGGVYDLRRFQPVLEEYAKKHRGSSMLVQMDKQVTMQGFFALSDIARKAGFTVVMIPAEEPAAPGPEFVEQR